MTPKIRLGAGWRLLTHVLFCHCFVSRVERMISPITSLTLAEYHKSNSQYEGGK